MISEETYKLLAKDLEQRILDFYGHCKNVDEEAIKVLPVLLFDSYLHTLCGYVQTLLSALDEDDLFDMKIKIFKNNLEHLIEALSLKMDIVELGNLMPNDSGEVH